MDLLETTFKFKDKYGNEVTAMIQQLGDRAVWTVKYFDWRKAQNYYETVPEWRGRQFVNQTRARQIIDGVLKSIK